MISRRGLIAGSAGMGMTGRGGQTPRRADQVTSPPPGVVLGPGSKNVVRARTVIVFGTGQGVGFFEYSGTPSGSNPPVAWAVPPGVTKDPFGNTLPVKGGFATQTGGAISQIVSGFLQLTSSSTSTAPAQMKTVQNGTGSEITLSTEQYPADGGAFQFNLNSPAAGGLMAWGGTAAVIGSLTRTTTAALEVQGGAIQTTSLNSIIANGNLQAQLGDIIASAGNLLINTIGKGLRVKEGSGAKQGTVLLSGGTATVNNTNVTAASRIFLTAQDNLSTGALRVSSRVAGTSFTITSSVAGDSGSVAWEIFEPA